MTDEIEAIDVVIERLKQQIADATKPGTMTVTEARQVYEELSSWLEGAIDGLEEDEEEPDEDDDEEDSDTDDEDDKEGD